jgi:hypothetical protein
MEVRVTSDCDTQSDAGRRYYYEKKENIRRARSFSAVSSIHPLGTATFPPNRTSPPLNSALHSSIV